MVSSPAKPRPAADTCEVVCVHEERVAEVAARMPSDSTVHRLCEAFRAIGDPTRTRILLALAQAEMCVCDLAALLRLTSPAVSHQLRILRGLGLVRYRREGKLAYYSLDDDHVMALIRMGREHIEE